MIQRFHAFLAASCLWWLLSLSSSPTSPFIVKAFINKKNVVPYRPTSTCRRRKYLIGGDHDVRKKRNEGVAMKNVIGDLWEEIIEFSTYGPAERKVLKERREMIKQQKQEQGTQQPLTSGRDVDTGNKSSGDSISLEAFQAAVKRTTTTGGAKDDMQTSMRSATPDATVATSETGNDDINEAIDFDGYQLRDLLIEKWGVPLDIDFQRGYDSNSVYCTVVPIKFGSRKCRHVTELDYLMHLQGVIEILYKYDNLDPFLHFIQTTNRIPKPGTDSVPFRLVLSPSQLERILGGGNNNSKR